MVIINRRIVLLFLRTHARGSQVCGGRRVLVMSAGSIRLLGPVSGPSQYVLTLQMEVRSRHGVVMSRHIAHVTVHVGAHRF